MSTKWIKVMAALIRSDSFMTKEERNKIAILLERLSIFLDIS